MTRLLINVYLPCSGSNNRLIICSDLLADIWSWRERYSDCECAIAGDFNTVMGSNDAVAFRLNDFVNSCSLVRCDDLFPSQKVATYVNLSLDQCSHIDYILVSKVNDVTCFTVLDPDVNFSDHLPLFVELSFSCTARPDLGERPDCKARTLTQPQLRWDKADLIAVRIIPIPVITCSQWGKSLRILRKGSKTAVSVVRTFIIVSNLHTVLLSLFYIQLLMRLFTITTRVSSNSGGTKNLLYLKRLLLSQIDEFGKTPTNLDKVQFFHVDKHVVCNIAND